MTFSEEMSPAEYGLAGTGSCKNVSVDIDEAIDGSHYEISIDVGSETTPTHFRFRLGSLDHATAILRFMSDHIGTDGFQELRTPLAGSTELIIAKDDEDSDRFFMKVLAGGAFVEQTLGGVSAASLIKALLPAIKEARTPATDSNREQGEAPNPGGG